MSLPDQLLLSDLLALRVRCDRGLEHGVGQMGWMHPPVHRLLGWASRPSALSTRRCIWRLDQLCGLSEAEALVQGDPADTDLETLERLPTLLGAVLLSAAAEPLGRLADAAVELRSGRILHYLVARSDPRLPGGSRWRLSPERIVDQRPGEVATALQGLGDLPLARASLRETLLRRSRRWRDQWDEEASRLRDQFQQASGRFEDRLEGWLEEPPWEEPRQAEPPPSTDEIWPDEAWPPAGAAPAAQEWDRSAEPSAAQAEPWLDEEAEHDERGRRRQVARGSGRSLRFRQERTWLEADSDSDPLADAWDGGQDHDRADQPAPWPDARDDGPPEAASGRRPRGAASEADDPWV